MIRIFLAGNFSGSGQMKVLFFIWPADYFGTLLIAIKIDNRRSLGHGIFI